MISLEEYENNVQPSWCPGCGNFGIIAALKQALLELGLHPRQVLLISGIGQAAKLPHYMRCNAINGLHGRSLPLATAAKLANHELTIIVIGGDGDCYGEGGNHFIHALRRNPDITLLVHNNQVFGLTRGQASPTSERGFVTKTQPRGVVASPLNPLTLAISQDASFVGRGYAGNGEHLTGLIKEAILNRGFSFLDILQPCVSFDHKHTYGWYQERVTPLDHQHDPYDKMAAYRKAEEWGATIPLGIIFRTERPPFEKQQPVLSRGPLIAHMSSLRELEAVLDEFM